MSFLLFIVNPFLGFLRSMKDLTQKSSAIVFIFFYALFGFAISFTLTSADSYRVGAAFCQYQYSTSEVLLFFKDGRIPDLYRYLVYSILRPFTDNPKILFLIFGFIYGVFTYFVFRAFYKEWGTNKKNKFFFIIVCCLLSMLAFTNVNGVRFSTATALFIFSFIEAFYYKKRVAYFGVLLAPFVHFSFYFVIITFIVYSIINLLKGRTKISFYMMVACFLASIFVSNNMVEGLLETDEVDTGNLVINDKVNMYSVENAVKSANPNVSESLYRQANKLYNTFFGWIKRLIVFAILCAIYLRRQTIVLTRIMQKFYVLILVMFALSYITNIFFITVARFHDVATILLLFFLLNLYKINRISFVEKLIIWLIPIFLYMISFHIVNAPRLVSSIFWYLPPPAIILDGWNFGPIDYIY